MFVPLTKPMEPITMRVASAGTVILVLPELALFWTAVTEPVRLIPGGAGEGEVDGDMDGDADGLLDGDMDADGEAEGLLDGEVLTPMKYFGTSRLFFSNHQHK
jgi:hypothetical protein